MLALNPEATHGVDTQLGETAIADSELLEELNGDHFALVQVGRKEDKQAIDWRLWGHNAIVDNAHGSQNAFVIGIVEERYPVHVSWDPQLLTEKYPLSFITDWFTGCWFDACFGYETIKQMATDSEASFEFPAQYDDVQEYIQSIDKRLGLIYVSLTDRGIHDAISNATSTESPVKTIVNGQIRIHRGDKSYTVQGQEAMK